MTNPTFNPSAQNLLNSLASKMGGTSSANYQLIYNAISASPALVNQLNNDSLGSSPKINGFQYVANGGSPYFDRTTQTIVIPQQYLDSLNTGFSTQPYGSEIIQNALITGLGHELSHSESYKSGNNTYQLDVNTQSATSKSNALCRRISPSVQAPAQR
jgi:hypothetical protein